MTHYAVGDIQGCFDELMQLLEKIDFDTRQDTLWVAGDAVNRGPQSKQTLAFLYDNRDCVQMVLGNHDLHLLAVGYGHRDCKKSDTLNDILQANEKHEWLTWLRQQPLCHYDPELDYAMVHAGIPPQWTIAQAQCHSREVEACLQSDNFNDFLANMYGNTPSTWQADLDGHDRLRYITNSLTRIRIIDSQGRLDLSYKGDLTTLPTNRMPWFNHPDRQTQQQKIIFGHWAALLGHIDPPYLFGLDTGCVWGQQLSALRLSDQQVFSTHAQTR